MLHDLDGGVNQKLFMKQRKSVYHYSEYPQVGLCFSLAAEVCHSDLHQKQSPMD